jgi:hypothetical protein
MISKPSPDHVDVPVCWMGKNNLGFLAAASQISKAELHFHSNAHPLAVMFDSLSISASGTMPL